MNLNDKKRKSRGPRTTALLHRLERLHHRLWNALARTAEVGVSPRGWKNRVARFLRVLILSALSFNINEVPVRSAALVFTTLLIFIPLTIILSSIAGWLGYLELVRTMIPHFLQSFGIEVPLGPLMSLLERAESMSFRQLGMWGSIALLVMFYFSMSNIEKAMNRVWNVRKGRGWPGRFASYTPFLLMLAGLVLITVVVLFRVHGMIEDWWEGHMASFTLPGGAYLLGPWSIILFLWALIVLLIVLLPNTKVRWSSGILGAAAATGILYLLSRFLLLFPMLLIARNQILYGSLVIFPVALLLVYVFWVTVLFGAAVAFVHQKLRPQAGRLLFFTADPSGMVKDWKSVVRQSRRLYLLPEEERAGEKRTGGTPSSGNRA